MLSNLLQFTNMIQECKMAEFDTTQTAKLKEEFINSNIVFYITRNRLYFLDPASGDQFRSNIIGLDTAISTQFNDLPINGRKRIIYVLVHNYLKYRGFFYVGERQRAVYMPKYEDEARKNSRLFTDRDGIVIHEGFDYQLLIISDTYYLAIKPKRYFTKDGFINISPEQRDALSNIILRANTRYCGENKKWLDFWISYLRGSNRNKIVLDYRNAPFVLRLDDILYKIV